LTQSSSARLGRTLDEVESERLAVGTAFAAARVKARPAIEVANAITLARAKLGWSQAELATRLGTTRSAVSRLESGRHLPTFDTLVRVADVLKLSFQIGASDSGPDRPEIVVVTKNDRLDVLPSTEQAKATSLHGSDEEINDAGTPGTIDRSTAHEIIHYLQADPERGVAEWTSRGAFNTTLLLMNTPHLVISANPTSDSPAEGAPAIDPDRAGAAHGHTPYTVLLDALGDLISCDAPSADVLRQATYNTQAWAWDNLPTLETARKFAMGNQAALGYLKLGPDLWIDHLERSGGMFDESFLPVIANVMHLSAVQAEQLHRISQDEEQVRYAYEHLESSDTGRLIATAFVVTWLLRGRLHDELARLRGQQLVQHPLREMFQPARGRFVTYELTNVASYLSAIALNLARSEPDLDSRIKRWADTVIRTKAAVEARLVDLSARADPLEAAMAAVDAASSAQVVGSRQEIEEAARVGMGQALARVGMVTLSPWTSVGSHDLTSLDILAATPTGRGDWKPINDLADGPPGRIQLVWLG